MTVEFNNDIYTIDFTDPINGSFAIQPFTTNGPISPTSASLAPGAVTASTTLTLIGRGLPGYGESVLENMVHMLEHFAGPTAPTYMIPGQMWFDTTGLGELKVRDKANADWTPVLTAGVDLDFGGFKGINVGNATDPTDAMNQQSSDARYVEIAGDAMTAAANLTFSGGGEVLGLPATPSATAAASKEYVDAEIVAAGGTLYVNVAGDTMTGDLILNGPPTVGLQAVTKDYADTTFVDTAGDTMLGFLTLAADPSIALHAATKQYVDFAVGSVGGDGVVASGSFDQFTGNGTITLLRTESLPDVLITNINSHPHTASEVTYQTAEPGQQLDTVDPASFPSYSQDAADFEFDRAAKSINSRNKRQFALGSDPGWAGATFTMAFPYPAESNRLQIHLRVPAHDYLSGLGTEPLAQPPGARKLIADERGVGVIDLSVNSLVLTDGKVVPSSLTGLSLVGPGPFTFTVSVDGAPAVPLSITVPASVIYGTSPAGLTTAINDELISNAVPAVAEFDDSAILIWSNTTGSASSVAIVDTGLFAALTFESSVLDFTVVTGATLPTGAVPAAWFDASSTGTTYRFWFDDGSTMAPAAGGTSLTAVAFTGAETNQDISDLVEAALLAADGEFAGATNSGTTITVMTLTAVGTVPDTTDGSPGTGANLFVAIEGVTTAITSIAGATHDYSEDGPALSDSSSFTLLGAPAAADEFDIIRIK